MDRICDLVFTQRRKVSQSRMRTENEIAKEVVGVCFKIHTLYGPGLFESVYERIFCYEWEKMIIPYTRQCGINVIHEGQDMGIGFIPDIIIDNKVILELKSVETLAEVHYKQLLNVFKTNEIEIRITDKL